MAIYPYWRQRNELADKLANSATAITLILKQIQG